MDIDQFLKQLLKNQKTEKEIVTDFDLFSTLIQNVFGHMGIKKNGGAN